MRTWSIAVAGLAFAAVAIGADQESSAVQIWKKTTEAYEALDSYSDTGTVVTEYGAAGAKLSETHSFKTALKRPRRFYFEFNEDAGAGADRFVIWCDAGEFNSWWATTSVHEAYPQGQGINAFAMGSLPTRGSAVLIPALIFAQAGLKGPLLSLEELKLDGIEKIDGRNHHKIAGIARERYGNDYVAGERRTDVWVDAQTFLIRKVVQHTPLSTGGGVVDRTTIVLKPVANAAPAAGAFTFAVPPAQP